MHGGDLIASVLQAQGTQFLFTLCGGHISPILVGCKQRGIRVIDTRHEATAVFAADAVARLTGQPGVAAATALKGRGALQDIDQMALLRPHVKWAAAARRVRDLVPLVEQAFREAQRGVPGPAFVECPVDLLYDEQLVRQWYGASSGGRSLADRAVKLYLRRHVRRLFAGAGRATAGEKIIPPPPEPDPAQI